MEEAVEVLVVVEAEVDLDVVEDAEDLAEEEVDLVEAVEVSVEAVEVVQHLLDFKKDTDCII